MNLGRNKWDAPPDCVIFSGTFDPPHFGHMACVQNILNFFPECSVIIIPTPHPPLNAFSSKTPVAVYADRLAMAQSAFNELGSRVQISNLEAFLPAPQYTIQTLRVLAPQYASLALLLGEDQLMKFSSWKDPIEILKISSLVVQARPPAESCRKNISEMVSQLLNEAENLVQRLDLASSWSFDSKVLHIFSKESNWRSRIFFLPGLAGDISSSNIRHQLADRDAHLIDGLPEKVVQYIKSRALYSSSTRRGS